MSETAAQPPDAETASDHKRYVLIGGILVVVVAVVFFVIWPDLRITLAINGLNSTNPKERQGKIRELQEHEDVERVSAHLLDAVLDEDRTFEVRRTCANILLKRNRLPDFERVLKTGSLGARGVALSALKHESYFQDTYVDDPAYKVRETVLEWLRRDGDTSRSEAIQLAKQLNMEEAVPLIRPLIRRPEAQNVHELSARRVMLAAASALQLFQDCDAMPELAGMAIADPDPQVRLRYMQIVHRAVFQQGQCPDVVSEGDMRGIVDAALASDDKSLRMGAMLILREHKSWAVPQAVRMQEILESDRTSPERRLALEVLASIGDPDFMAGFSRYFHDPEPPIRSSALNSTLNRKDPRFEGCWIGLVENEADNQSVFLEAVQRLKKAARKWIGLSAEKKAEASMRPKQWRADLMKAFGGGELDGMTRAAWAEKWFAWWCDELALTPEQTQKALDIRKRFWAAARRGDAQGAAKVLDERGVKVPGLFSYEEGWLLQNGASG